MEYRTVSAKLSIDEFTLINDYCKRTKSNPSALIRELLLEELAPSIPANVAGNNVFEYDKKHDSFIWAVLLDNGKHVEVLRSVSPEYIRELCATLSSALASRSDLQGKRKKVSIPIPKKLIKVSK